MTHPVDPAAARTDPGRSLDDPNASAGHAQGHVVQPAPGEHPGSGGGSEGRPASAPTYRLHPYGRPDQAAGHGPAAGHGYPPQGQPGSLAGPAAYPTGPSQGFAPPTGYPTPQAPGPYSLPGATTWVPAYPPPGQAGLPYAGPPPIAAPPPSLRGDYVRWGRRVLAYLVDTAPNLIGVSVFYLGYVQAVLAGLRTGVPDLSAGAAFLVVGLVLMLLGLAWTSYNRWLVAGRTGQSLGKRLTHCRLVDERSDAPIGPQNAFLRDLVHLVDGVAYVGYLWPLWDVKRQTFADKLMQTVVVEAPRPPTAAPT